MAASAPASRQRSAARVRRHTAPPEFPLRAIAALFLERQHLDRPRARPLAAETLGAFAAGAGGIQLDSINVVERAHYLTAWARYGAYPRAELDRLVYGERVLFEYWAHAACLVPRADLAAWRRAMADYRFSHTGWSSWLRKNARVVRRVETEIRERGPLGNADFRDKRPGGGAGWWNWKPATHALHYLWMTGRILVHSRIHFHKRFDLAERVLPELEATEPLDREAFARWHVRRSLAAMGAATELDLRMYLTFPRGRALSRKAALQKLVRSGAVVEVRVEGDRSRWFALAEDVASLGAAAAIERPSQGTTLLAPFDSLLWHRERARRLFGFDYRIEVYTPGHKRVHGYYTLPILHEGHLIGRADVKTHRTERTLEVRHVHLEPWASRGAAPPADCAPGFDPDSIPGGLADALRSLAAFVGADRVTLTRTSPSKWRRPLTRALAAVHSPS